MAIWLLFFCRKVVSVVQTVREMIPEYKANIEQLRRRRSELLRERELDPSFEKRYKLTVRICRLKSIITSTESALHDMLEYDK